VFDRRSFEFGVQVERSACIFGRKGGNRFVAGDSSLVSKPKLDCLSGNSGRRTAGSRGLRSQVAVEFVGEWKVEIVHRFEYGMFFWQGLVAVTSQVSRSTLPDGDRVAVWC